MQLRTLGTLATGLSLWLGSAPAAEPAKPPLVQKAKAGEDQVANQKLANDVVAKLSASDTASDVDIDVFATAGAVSVVGNVGTDAQKKAILEVVRRVNGVKLVKDGLEVKAVAVAAPKPTDTKAVTAMKPAALPVKPPVMPVTAKMPPQTAPQEIVQAQAVAAPEPVFVPEVAIPAEPVVAEPASVEVPAEPAKLTIPQQMPPKVAVAKPVAKVRDDKAANQKLADAVFNALLGSGTVGNTDLDVFATAGAVTVMGNVGSDAQKQAIIEVIRHVDGVTMVKDGTRVVAMAPKPMPAPQSVFPAQAVGPMVTIPPSAVPPVGAPRFAVDPQIDPVPVGPGGNVEGMAPPLPQNAWPTYAPYNNVSRVAYPTAYPYNAFPFIGPYYPFPKVPLGWRKVTLEWEDGHWWLGRKQAPADYWRVKFGY